MFAWFGRHRIFTAIVVIALLGAGGAWWAGVYTFTGLGRDLREAAADVTDRDRTIAQLRVDKENAERALAALGTPVGGVDATKPTVVPTPPPAAGATQTVPSPTAGNCVPVRVKNTVVVEGCNNPGVRQVGTNWPSVQANQGPNGEALVLLPNTAVDLWWAEGPGKPCFGAKFAPGMAEVTLVQTACPARTM